MSKILKAFISLCLMFLLVAPIVAVFMITKIELKQYEPQPVPPLIEKAYGEICAVERMDIQETITISGTFVSTKKFFMEIPKMNNPYGARILAESGDEILEGQLIGYSEDLKTEIKASASGIIYDIHLGSTSYITMESIDDLALKCLIDNTTMAVLLRDGLNLSMQNGDEVNVINISKKQDDQGNTEVLFSIPNGIYGQCLNDVQLQTGRVFYDTLVIDFRCLFHLNGDYDTWYVRTVDKNGNFLDNKKVNVSFTSENFVAISGVPEGTLCDSGYSKVAGES